MISLKDKPKRVEGKYIFYDVTQAFIDTYQTGQSVKDDGLTFYEIDNKSGKKGWTISKPKAITTDDVSILIKKVIENDNKTNLVLLAILPKYEKAKTTNPKAMVNFEEAYFSLNEAVAKRQREIEADPTIKTKGTVDKLKSDIIAIKQKIWTKLGFGELGEIGEPITLICVTLAFVALAGASVYITYKLNKEYTSKLTESDTQLKSAEALKVAIANLPIAPEQKAQMTEKVVAMETEAKTKIIASNESGYNQGTTDAKTTIPTAIKWVAGAVVVSAVVYGAVKLFGKDETQTLVVPHTPQA